MARTAHLLAIAAVAACGGAAKPTATVPAVDPAACRPAYTDYEAKWRTALLEDLEEAHMVEGRDDIVAAQVATLPKRIELVKLRASYTLVEQFIPEAAWPVAFAAADLAIEQCGEGAPRPK